MARRVSILFALFVAACGSRGKTGPVAIADDESRAASLLDARALPDRFEVVELADRLAVASVREGAAAKKASLAGRLRERLFRELHGESDGREAAALLERAIEGEIPPDACRDGVSRAQIVGELAHDPVVTLHELVPLRERFGEACASEIEPLVTTLAAFRERAGIAAAVAPPSMSAPPPAASRVFAAEEAVASPPPSNEPVKLVAIHPFGDVDSARVVLELSGATSFEGGVASAKHAGGGPRVFVDLAKTKLGKQKKELSLGGLVERIRLAPHGDGTRVVLDLAKPAFRRVFYLREPFRVVIDVSTREGGKDELATRDGTKRVLSRVVLDPGHGGNDPGATGPSGLREKDVTLDIAHRAAPVLARELGVTTLLTRDADDYVSLEERTARANAFGADVFVSIHCNASESPVARGVQTFVLDTTSDDVAARVAARENRASAEAGADVAKLLADLKLADLGARSTHFAELLQRAAIASIEPKFPGTPDQGVKTGGFYVLVGAEMPAVLFETSFISNGVEESRLASEEYRQRLADAIVNALRAYREGR